MKRLRAWWAGRRRPNLTKGDVRLLAGVAILLLSAWLLSHVVFFITTMLLGLAIIYVAIFGGEEAKK